MQPWFHVDKKGLAKLLERKGKHFILYELWQNAADENTTRIDIVLKWLEKGVAYLEVRDDSPEGFKDLSHAYTMFAESIKKADATKRGRFNLGEKLILALCSWAMIETTTGTVEFDDSGRHNHPSKKLPAGSVFSAKLKLKASEFEQFEQAARSLLPPAGIDTYFNGELIPSRAILKRIEASLPTEIGDSEGILRTTTRKTWVDIVEPLPDETAHVYELGIPVVETEGRWHINIGQKVPLNMDRDNVTPSYLGKVRALVAEHMADQLTEEDANASWVRDAVTRHGDEMEAETVVRLKTLRFGDKAVAYDPTDPEANARAIAAGYQVVHGGSMNKAEWDAVKRVGALLPAGQVTPGHKALTGGPDAPNLKMQEKLTPQMKAFVVYCKRIGKALLGFEPSVKIANDIGENFMAAYGGRTFIANVARLGYNWFNALNREEIHDLLIHEFAHEYASNHLDEQYYHALTRLGARMVTLALEKPDLFDYKALCDQAQRQKHFETV